MSQDVSTDLDQAVQEAKDYLVRIAKIVACVAAWSEKFKISSLEVETLPEPVDKSIKSWEDYRNNVKTMLDYAEQSFESKRKDIVSLLFACAVNTMPSDKVVVIIKASFEEETDTDRRTFDLCIRELKDGKAKYMPEVVIPYKDKPVFFAFNPTKLLPQKTIDDIASRYTGDPLEFEASYA